MTQVKQGACVCNKYSFAKAIQSKRRHVTVMQPCFGLSCFSLDIMLIASSQWFTIIHPPLFMSGDLCSRGYIKTGAKIPAKRLWIYSRREYLKSSHESWVSKNSRMEKSMQIKGFAPLGALELKPCREDCSELLHKLLQQFLFIVIFSLWLSPPSQSSSAKTEYFHLCILSHISKI